MRSDVTNNIQRCQKGVDLMTSNQIRRFEASANAAHALRQDLETNRSNVMKENLTYWADRERERENRQHNRTTEVETERHNRATEIQAKQQLLENSRQFNLSQLQSRQLETAKLAETRRSNLAQEKERNRANIAGEMNTQYSNATSRIKTYGDIRNQAKANTIRFQELEESVRRNSANIASQILQNSETHRANIEREKENLRSHSANESIDWSRLAQTQQQINEQRRHNYQSENIDRYRITSQFTASLISTLQKQLSDTGKAIGGLAYAQ